MIAYENLYGKIDISDEYLSKLIGHEVVSCFGVVGMVPHGNKQKIVGKLSKDEPLNTGIKLIGGRDNLSVELHIVVLYGMNISAIANSITEKVIYAVNNATGINVEKVIVKVDGIKE